MPGEYDSDPRAAKRDFNALFGLTQSLEQPFRHAKEEKSKDGENKFRISWITQENIDNIIKSAPNLSVLSELDHRNYKFNSETLERFSALKNSKEGDPEISSMTSPSREEIDAKLALVEAKTETRFAELNGKLDRIADSISVLQQSINGELAQVKTGIKDVANDNKNTRTTIIITVIAAVIAAVAAIYTVQSSLLTAFQTGLAAQSASQASTPSTSHSTPPPTNQTPAK